VGIGAGGPHITDESWELDRGCDLVSWCGILERGVDLWSVSFLEVLTSLQISAYLECCFAALLKPSIARVGLYPAYSLCPRKNVILGILGHIIKEVK
jgi:hypothetical protein